MSGSVDWLAAPRSAVDTRVAADLRPTADAWGVAVVRYEITDINRHNKESAA